MDLKKKLVVTGVGIVAGAVLLAQSCNSSDYMVRKYVDTPPHVSEYDATVQEPARESQLARSLESSDVGLPSFEGDDLYETRFELADECVGKLDFQTLCRIYDVLKQNGSKRVEKFVGYRSSRGEAWVIDQEDLNRLAWVLRREYMVHSAKIVDVGQAPCSDQPQSSFGQLAHALYLYRRDNDSYLGQVIGFEKHQLGKIVACVEKTSASLANRLEREIVPTSTLSQQEYSARARQLDMALGEVTRLQDSTRPEDVKASEGLKAERHNLLINLASVASDDVGFDILQRHDIKGYHTLREFNRRSEDIDGQRSLLEYIEGQKENIDFARHMAGILQFLDVRTENENVRQRAQELRREILLRK